MHAGICGQNMNLAAISLGLGFVWSNFGAGINHIPELKSKLGFGDSWTVQSALYTGDLGYLDEAGYLYFVDRIKDYIRRRGENISSTEIERVVNSHPGVIESAAISVKSELSEDEVKVVVVLKEGENLTPEELLAFCEERMPYFAIPRYVEFLESLPKTPNEKVQKSKLREAGILTLLKFMMLLLPRKSWIMKNWDYAGMVRGFA